MSENEWLESYAEELRVQSLTNEEIGALLDLARDVAHGTERKNAPLATYLAGLHVGRGGTLDGAVSKAGDLL